MDINDGWNDSESEADSGRGSNWSETLSEPSNDMAQHLPGVAENIPQHLALLCNNRIYDLVPDGEYDNIGDELEKCTLTIDLADEVAQLNPALALSNPEPIVSADDNAAPVPGDTDPPGAIRMVNPSFTVVYTVCKCVYDNNNKLISSKIAHTEAFPCYDISEDDNDVNVDDDNGGVEYMFSDEVYEATNNGVDKDANDDDNDGDNGGDDDDDDEQLLEPTPFKRMRLEPHL